MGRIAVGLPEVGDEGQARCPVMLDGHFHRPTAIAGADTLQALVLGLQFLATMLHEFVAQGGRVLYPDDDEDVPLDAVFGGLRLAPPEPGPDPVDRS